MGDFLLVMLNMSSEPLEGDLQVISLITLSKPFTFLRRDLQILISSGLLHSLLENLFGLILKEFTV